MKIALICPSNILYMPYVKNYEQILIEEKIDYEIINWDRFKMEEISEYKYRDNKIGHQRNYFDYLKYKRFLIKKLNGKQYDKIIVFGIQLSYFLKKILVRNYTGKYVIDIRDYNKILKLFLNFKKIIEGSMFIVLSSPGFKQWLPKSNRYLINHNTHFTKLADIKVLDKHQMERIKIANIGATRDFLINKKFINSLKNNRLFELKYHGDGVINNKIIKLIRENNIENVIITGRYEKEEEKILYEESDFINVLRYNDSINNKTALPNRLYNAAVYGKPLLAYKGTYLAEEIQRYNIGLVLKTMNCTSNVLENYLYNFNNKTYLEGRNSYFEKVVQDNNNFKIKLKEFINIQ